jgi:hypothetical protein
MSIYGGPDIITDGLILHLDAANSKSYPGSGTVWADLSGNNRNGILTNGVGYSAIDSGFLTFDGVNDHVDHTNNSIINNIVAIDIWFYITNTNNILLICAGDNTYNSSLWNWSLFACCSPGTSNNLLGRADAGGSGFNLGNINNVYLNRWNNITIIRNTGQFYRNGILLGTSTTSILSNKALRIGGMPGAYFAGRIASIKLYSTSLSPIEVRQNYDALKGRFGL